MPGGGPRTRSSASLACWASPSARRRAGLLPARVRGGADGGRRAAGPRRPGCADRGLFVSRRGRPGRPRVEAQGLDLVPQASSTRPVAWPPARGQCAATPSSAGRRSSRPRSRSASAAAARWRSTSARRLAQLAGRRAARTAGGPQRAGSGGDSGRRPAQASPAWRFPDGAAARSHAAGLASRLHAGCRHFGRWRPRRGVASADPAVQVLGRSSAPATSAARCDWT